MSVDNHISRRPGRTEVYGQAQLFHCNHYNRSIQQYIEDPDYVDSERILLQSAAETAYRQANRYLEKHPDATVEDLLEFAEEIFRFGGFGSLTFDDLTDACGTVVGTVSHYGEAIKLNMGNRTEPGEFFDRGFVAGILVAAAEAFDLPLGDGFDLLQPTSISLGGSHNRFVVDPAGESEWLVHTEPDEYDRVEPPESSAPAEESNVDETDVIEAVQGLDLTGNEEGLIPRFGVTLTRGYAEYYNKTTFRTADQIVEEMGDIRVAEEMFVEAGHICGFNTMGGIMTSPEWDAVVGPMLGERADWIHGIIAVINALGWGTWRVEELVPDETLRVRIYNPYESVGYARWFGTPEYPVDFTATGVASALMNLVYYGDVTDRPTLDDEYYADLFGQKGGFSAEQTTCAAEGDDYSEIIVER